MEKKDKHHDKRFHIAHREARMGGILVIIHFFIWYGCGYGLGSKSIETYRFVFGLPEWFFYSCIVGSIFMIILVILTVRYLFIEVPFSEEDPK